MTRNPKQIVFLFLKGNLYDSVNIEFNLSIFFLKSGLLYIFHYKIVVLTALVFVCEVKGICEV